MSVFQELDSSYRLGVSENRFDAVSEVEIPYSDIFVNTSWN